MSKVSDYVFISDGVSLQMFATRFHAFNACNVAYRSLRSSTLHSRGPGVSLRPCGSRHSVPMSPASVEDPPPVSYGKRPKSESFLGVSRELASLDS